MCGIVGILGQTPVAPLLMEALGRLEYRGYDSAGVATLEDGKIVCVRAEGKLRNLAQKLAQHPLTGLSGIGHTRWATHGKPTENNAHPHVCGKVAIVHNGIIENFRELRAELKALGHVFSTDTDSEVVVHLVDEAMKKGMSPAQAVSDSLPRLRGAFALAFLFDDEPDLMIGARRGSPLAVGFGMDPNTPTMYLGSDALALAPFTDTIAYLEDGDWVVLTRKGAAFFDSENNAVGRPVVKTQAEALFIGKGKYRHFMAKEIHEQPEVVGRTLGHYLDFSAGHTSLPFALPFDPRALDRLTICACGTAYMAGLTAKYWFERFAGLSVNIELASEFRYAEPPLKSGGVILFISQSGETADVLASLRYAKAHGQKCLGVVNVATSTLARESDLAVPTLAGPEIGVASTKAFTCQLAVLACLALAIGRERRVITEEMETKLVGELLAVPGLMAEALREEQRVEQIARELAQARDVLYLGRGTAFPLALEGALKLKELSYIHAEGYAAGELKHGPIALIDEKMPVIVIAPPSPVLEKTISNMEEVAARGGRLILIGQTDLAETVGEEVGRFVAMEPMQPDFATMVYAIPVQLLAYHTAVAMGKDADQPRNLAKSVTVE